MKWFRRIKREIIKYKAFRAYSELELELKCKQIWNELLSAEAQRNDLNKCQKTS